MRTIALFLFAFVLLQFTLGCNPSTEEASINITIDNPNSDKIILVKDMYSDAQRLFGNGDKDVIRLVDGVGRWSCKLSEPKFITTYYYDSIVDRNYEYVFYLSPGDELSFSFDSKKPEDTYVVTGKGSNNNQPAIQVVIQGDLNLELYKRDSLPYDVFSAITLQSRDYKKILDEYIAEHQPSNRFRKDYSMYVQYFDMWRFVEFKGSQRFSARDPFLRNEDEWQRIEDSLINVVPVCNDEMLGFEEHNYFLFDYLSRFKERLQRHPDLLMDYYGTASKEEAVKARNEDSGNRLKELIVQKHFTGKTAEYLYGTIFKSAIHDNEDGILEIFARFKQKYPQSQYIPYIEDDIQRIETRSNRSLTDEMILIDNPELYQTFDDILKLVKGNTILLDMWGTWCGPCRSEMSRNSDAIKRHFKDKELDYLYIANFDEERTSTWKELISYYGLTGTHILASRDLTNDIMDRIQGKGYPTYAVIRKDGSFELSKAGFPMNRELLIRQLEEALNDH